jgi:hypothetical protein
MSVSLTGSGSCRWVSLVFGAILRTSTQKRKKVQKMKVDRMASYRCEVLGLLVKLN